MSVGLRLVLRYASEAMISAVLSGLVRHNVELYRRRVVTQAPWSILWVPDQLVNCDATGCAVATEASLEDAAELFDRGAGSCGPLSCAYAAWLNYRVPQCGARIEVFDQGSGRWHVRAVVVERAGARVYDPQEMAPNVRSVRA